MREVNRRGPHVYGALVIDVRPVAEFAAGHVSGAATNAALSTR
jgi:rhodanese-related sulfurtransferase